MQRILRRLHSQQDLVPLRTFLRLARKSISRAGDDVDAAVSGSSLRGLPMGDRRESIAVFFHCYNGKSCKLDVSGAENAVGAIGPFISAAVESKFPPRVTTLFRRGVAFVSLGAKTNRAYFLRLHVLRGD
jgi:hypothetical protein